MNSFITKLDDYLNAILVKEIRQTVRGKFFWSIFFLYLGILALVLFIAIKEASNMGNMDGSPLAMIMMTILFFACGLVIPFQVGKRTGDESNDANNELLFITTMKPSSIANGKFLSGAIMILMLYSAIAPFLSLTLFMGGIDIRDLFLALVFSFLLSNVAILGQVYVGLTLHNSIVGSLHKGIFILIHIVLWFTACSWGGYLMEGRQFYYTNPWEAWNVCFWVICGILFVGFFIYSLIVSRLQPDSSNKNYIFRIVATCLWLLGSVLVLFTPKLAIPWCWIVMIALCGLSFSTVFEPDKYSNRIIKEIPKNQIMKIINFPFFYGMANSFLWVLLASFFTFVYAMVMNLSLSGSFGNELAESMKVCLVFLLFSNAYSFMANSLRKLISSNSKTNENFAYLTAIIAVTTIFLVVTQVMSRWDDSPLAMLGRLISPFGCLNWRRNEIGISIVSGSVLLIVGVLMNIKPMITQVVEYFTGEISYDSKGYGNYNYYKEPVRHKRVDNMNNKKEETVISEQSKDSSKIEGNVDKTDNNTEISVSDQINGSSDKVESEDNQ